MAASCSLIQIDWTPASGDSCMRDINKPLFDHLRCGPEPASIDHLTLPVKHAARAPNVAKVDADRQLCPATLPGYFHNMLLRWLLDGNGLLFLRRTCSSHLLVLIFRSQSIEGKRKKSLHARLSASSWRNAS